MFFLAHRIRGQRIPRRACEKVPAPTRLEMLATQLSMRQSITSLTSLVALQMLSVARIKKRPTYEVDVRHAVRLAEKARLQESNDDSQRSMIESKLRSAWPALLGTPN